MAPKGSKRYRKKKVKAKTKIDKALERRIAKLENEPEIKFIDTLSDGTGSFLTIPNEAATTNSIIYSVTDLSIGATAEQRVGDQVKSVGLQYRITIRGKPGAVECERVRFGFVMLSDINNNPPELNQIFTLSASAPVLQPMEALINRDFQDNIKVLMDKTIVLRPDADVSSSVVIPDVRFFKGYIRLGRTMKFNPSGDTTALSNAVYFYILTSATSGSGTPPANNPEFLANVRFMYKDN